MTKRRLLLADDSITIQKVVNLTFADEGIEVIAVGDGDAAIEKFVEAMPDLVMVDVNMPGFDGYKICEIIKQDEDTRHIPVILLVGSFEPFDEDEARRVGADDYLTKPFQSIRQLVGKVTALLDATGNTLSLEEPSIQIEETSAPSADVREIWSQTDSPAEEVPGGNTEDENTIQTGQIGSLPADETQKFSSDFKVEQPQAADSVSFEPSNNENVYEFPGGEEFLGENTNDQALNSAPDFFETLPDSEQNPTSETQEISSEKEDKKAVENAETSLLEIDDVNLLDLSPIAKADDGLLDFRDETIAVTKPFEPNEAAVKAEEETPPPVEEFQNAEQPETAVQPIEIQENFEPEAFPFAPAAAQSFDSANLSPEMIDAIADRVVEKLSDKIVREIAWEVVPQMADLIVRRMAEERLKN